MAEELTEDAEGRLIDKDGVEHIPDDVRRNRWFRAALWVGLAWCLLSTAALIASAIRGNWAAFWGVFADCVISWLAWGFAKAGIVFKD